MNASPLVAQDLGKRFRREWSLRGLTLEIPQGAVVGLAGPNAAGKSTLLALATGLLAPTEGTISVLGRDPLRDPGLLADVGYIAQGAPLYRSFTVAETIEYARRTNTRWDSGPAVDLLTSIPARTKVGSLSEGERARLALALVLGKRPQLVLLDEPFASLDPLAGRELLQLLMDGVAETGATVVVASHVDRRHRARLRPHRPAHRAARSVSRATSRRCSNRTDCSPVRGGRSARSTACARSSASATAAGS